MTNVYVVSTCFQTVQQSQRLPTSTYSCHSVFLPLVRFVLVSGGSRALAFRFFPAAVAAEI
jgi:hypothetical protein